jgi:hypothetical protein
MKSQTSNTLPSSNQDLKIIYFHKVKKHLFVTQVLIRFIKKYLVCLKHARTITQIKGQFLKLNGIDRLYKYLNFQSLIFGCYVLFMALTYSTYNC